MLLHGKAIGKISATGKTYRPNYGGFKIANKAFKSDSQRMAFFIPSLGSVFTVAWLSFVVGVAHTLMRR